ncbi:hypothetical protein B0A52_04631 [Exophiala mesophila]|uniref:L-ornithine N(5)-oxygenase n=1 Tax=Exophiala mesophila TaxID=212818 RepID=A0A438N8D5_EXOME|nr:hypothetical protein B0A52_04631 [Exophiala mesophila]
MPLIASPEVAYTDDDIPTYPQCTPQPIKIIHVGFGASGMLFAHKADKQLQNFELVCYEKNSVIGGTWYENRYPGCACDIPAHTYTFPFEPNPNWSGYYSYSDEIQEYFLAFAKKYGVEKYVQIDTEVLGATWDEGQGKWKVELKRKDGSTFIDTCDVLVNGAGVVNKWKWPTIEGLHDFQGVLAHSAAWDTSLDWSNKTIAVIGTGSSSIQMVPKFAETAKHLTVFMRNQTYIGPQFGALVSNKEADPEAMEPHAAGKHHYTEKEKQKFRDDPDYHLKYRKAVERSVVGGFRMFFRGHPYNIGAKKMMQDQMSERLGDRDDLKERFIPDWSPGCRRLTPGEGYLEALRKDNVRCVFSEITKITPQGLVTADGETHNVDILVCATGFKVQYLPHFTLTGIGGQVMQDQTEPNIYASIAAPGFPNYFVVNGPRGNWGQGCALPSHEVQIEYIVQCCRKMQEDGIRSMVPRQDVTTQLNLYMDAWHKKTSVWAEDCRSWYKDNKPGGRVYIWPGSLLHHLKFMKRPRYEHYQIEYRDPGNIFAFLGNGLTITEEKFEGSSELPIPYIRNNEDEVWDVE